MLAFDDFLRKYSINDSSVSYLGKLPTNTYHKYCKNIYSQNGEDGIIEQLISGLGIHSGVFCDFGASDGISSSNVYNLIVNHDWSGVCIEPDPNRFFHLEKNLQSYISTDKVVCYNGYVKHDDASLLLDNWLDKTQLKLHIPKDFDLLSIDVDYYDYNIWKSLSNYSPKIVIIEVNSYRDPITKELPGDKPKKNDVLLEWYPRRIGVGCSFMSMVELGLEKGYIPVSFTGNLTFVRKDLVVQLKEFPYIVSNNPYDYVDLYTNLSLWNNRWSTNSALIFNVAIRNYYKSHSVDKELDFKWILEHIQEYGNMLWNYKFESSHSS